MAEPENLEKFETLVKIIARLRSPEGCPWDREQTHASLREFLLEECYEALEALDSGNHSHLCEELGDILLEIMLHSQIAAEAKEFTIDDVIRGLNAKMIRRHPHVFGSTKAESAAEVERNWEEIKKQERGENNSLLGSVPSHLPALSYSKAVQRRVAEAGFDWPDIDGVIDKLAEEVAEFKESADEQKALEFGDMLFTLVNIARRMGIDSEIALREANAKFTRRFNHMEKLCQERGISFAALSFESQNALWDEAKKATRERGGEVNDG